MNYNTTFQEFSVSELSMISVRKRFVSIKNGEIKRFRTDLTPFPRAFEIFSGCHVHMLIFRMNTKINIS